MLRDFINEPKKPKGPTQAEKRLWTRQNKTIVDAGFATITEPYVFPILLVCYDPEIGDTMRGFGGVDVRFKEWREWLAPVAGGQVGVSRVAVYEAL
jgi:hypothetical protein